MAWLTFLTKACLQLACHVKAGAMRAANFMASLALVSDATITKQRVGGRGDIYVLLPVYGVW
jgi:hypothetical protein